MRFSREDAQVLFGAGRIGHGNELAVPLPLLGEVPKAKHLRVAVGILLGHRGGDEQQEQSERVGVFQSGVPSSVEVCGGNKKAYTIHGHLFESDSGLTFLEHQHTTESRHYRRIQGN